MTELKHFSLVSIIFLCCVTSLLPPGASPEFKRGRKAVTSSVFIFRSTEIYRILYYDCSDDTITDYHFICEFLSDASYSVTCFWWPMQTNINISNAGLQLQTSLSATSLMMAPPPQLTALGPWQTWNLLCVPKTFGTMIFSLLQEIWYFRW